MLSLGVWREGILTPINNTANSVGSSARLSESFDLLQQEVSNDIAIDREPTNWNNVLTLSYEILNKQSKDLLVLAYSIRSVIAAYRYEGFAESLSVLDAYMDAYWIECFRR